jgi:DNA end-binding protein Ku
VPEQAERSEEARENARKRTGPVRAQEPKSLFAREEARPTLAPVEQVSIRKGTDEVLAKRSVVKGYEFEKNRFVAVEPEELKSLAPKTSSGMEIQEFVQLADVDPVYFETSYYVSPEEAGEKAYALLYRSMQQTALVAVAQFAMHGREHVVILRPGKTGILAHTMFFASEVRADEEYRADTRLVAEKELNLAETLIRSLAGPFEPEKYRDTYRERLESMIAKKVRGEPIPMDKPAQQAAEVVDIAEALRRSLANVKKPVASEGRQKPPASSSSGPKKLSRGAGQK